MVKVDLDDSRVFGKYDKSDMLACLHEMSEQCQRAWDMAMAFDIPSAYSRVDKVVILGMGGSAIGGDLVSGLSIGESRIPVLVNRSYDLPAFVDDRTLVIASSYSGNTEETLSSFEQAMGTKSKKLVITTGGKLKETAEAHNVPVFSFHYRVQPRAALPFSLLPLLAFLQKLGFLSDKSTDVVETVRVLDTMSRTISEKTPLVDNSAKQLASRLHGKLAVLYGGGIVSEVAHRWKTQINENSKSWSFYEVFPELNHNAVVGYQFPQELASKIMVVLLQSSHLNRRIQLRYQVTSQLLEKVGVDYQSVDGEGISTLSHIMSLVLYGDYVSCYLAILNNADPTPVVAIDFLKEQLAKG